MMHKSMCGRVGPASVKQDITLKDYIERKQEPASKKLTFEEWYKINCADTWWKDTCEDAPIYEHAEQIWKAAQENK